MKKIYYFLSLIILLSSCVSTKNQKSEVNKGSEGTVSIENHASASPFQECKGGSTTASLADFFDPNKFFKMKVNPNWNYSYFTRDEVTQVHNWKLKKDTNQVLTIIVDSEKIDKINGRRNAKITHAVPTIYMLNQDTCDYLRTMMEFEEEGVKSFVFENRFQYYNENSQVIFYLFLVDTKPSKAEINERVSCSFQVSIESFTVLKE
jgi:PBP1b-binding outer membrane lipoprotein LpoB